MNRTKLGLAAAAIAVLASTAVGSAALAAKGGGSDQRGTQTSSSTSGTFGTGSAKGTPDGQHPGMGGHTAVTGDALSKLTAALKAKGYVLQQAMSDADGSYDVAATKNGTNVMLDVSKDLSTITERQGPPAGAKGMGSKGMGGAGMGDHTAVTGDALSKLTAALKAKGYVLQQAMSDADGSYDVAATKNGTNVMLDVSKDLATITERQGPPAGTHLGGPGAPQQAPGSSTGGQPTIQGSAA